MIKEFFEDLINFVIAIFMFLIYGIGTFIFALFLISLILIPFALIFWLIKFI